MDSLTHLALGNAMGVFAAGATPAIKSGAYWGALVGNSLPDIDVPAGHLVGRGWAFHRKFTHTPPGIITLSLAVAGIIKWVNPGSGFWLNFAWTLAGCVVHILLDCHNLYGTRPLWPWSEKVVGWGVLFIMDPLILATTGLGSIAQGFGLVTPSVMRWLYIGVWVYIAGRWAARYYLMGRVRATSVERADIAPWLSAWRYFRDSGGKLEYGKISAFGGRVVPLAVVEPASGPAVDASRRDPSVAAFLRRARYPYARVEPDEAEGYRVIWQDLYTRLRGWRGGVEVRLDAGFEPLN